jgi:acyl dehydratase
MRDAPSTVPQRDRYLEDYPAGAGYEYGPVKVTEEEIIEFATRFDPQFFHIDPEAAADGPFGGIIASGWHTTALLMRLFADHFLSPVSSLGSPGVDELRWPAPVRPDDELRLRLTILENRYSRSKPDRGIIRTRAEMVNQHGDVVLSLVAVSLLRARPADIP